jgi:hypothetical protein
MNKFSLFHFCITLFNKKKLNNKTRFIINNSKMSELSVGRRILTCISQPWVATGIVLVVLVMLWLLGAQKVNASAYADFMI